MGSSESTGRSNGTKEERQGENDNSEGALAAIAVVAAGAAAAAWGISRMLSDSTDTENQKKDDVMKIKAPGIEPYLLNSGTTSHAGDKSEYRSYPTCINWPPFLPGRFKMNTDGAARVNSGPTGYGARVNTGPSGYGGILRDHRGKWIRGFHGFIGESDSLTAEFIGVLKGLELLDKLGLGDSILECDSTAAIDWINQEDSLYPPHSEIIRRRWEDIKECRRLIHRNGITLIRISRDANKCADKLANMAIDKEEGYKEIINLPDEIKHIVNRESSVF